MKKLINLIIKRLRYVLPFTILLWIYLITLQNSKPNFIIKYIDRNKNCSCPCERLMEHDMDNVRESAIFAKHLNEKNHKLKRFGHFSNSTSENVTKNVNSINSYGVPKQIHICNNTSPEVKKNVRKETAVTYIHGVPVQEVDDYANYMKTFNYPLDIDIVKLVRDFRRYGNVSYQPINVFRYNVLKSPNKICFHANLSLSDDTKMVLFVIKSATQNSQQREDIRKTWGAETHLNGFIIKRVFMLGITDNTTTATQIKHEHGLNNDIVQHDFYDHYFNNTLKMIGSINWVVKNCNNSHFVLFVDDDYLVSPYYLVQYLKRLSFDPVHKLYIGHVRWIEKPARDSANKWFVSYKEYPYEYYPSFVLGGAILVSMETIKDIKVSIPYVKSFRLDDVYLGIVIFKLDIKPTNNEFFSDAMSGRKEQSIALHLNFGRPYNLRREWSLHMKTLEEINDENERRGFGWMWRRSRNKVPGNRN